jgi:ribosomal-protein-serine acetyltransferase
MKLSVDDSLYMELINHQHAQAIFEMVDTNRTYLAQWLTFVDKMTTVSFAENFVKSCLQKNTNGEEFAFVLVDHEMIVGRIGVYNIDQENKIGEIGYWIVEHAQGRGIITRACKVLIDYCFTNLLLNKIAIKCATENIKSQAIPIKFGFKQEGIIREGELLNGKLVDLYLYALLNSDNIK